MAVAGVTTKDKQPITITPPLESKPTTAASKSKPVAIDLDAQPTTGGGPTALKEFYENQTQPKVSSGCADAANAGKSPGEIASACTVREWALLSSTTPIGSTPVEQDGDCVKAAEIEGGKWGEATGEELKDRIKQAPVPIVRHRVAKEVKEATQEIGKEWGRAIGTSVCSPKLADPAAFAKNHGKVELPIASKAPAAPAPEPLFTPADPAKAVSK